MKAAFKNSLSIVFLKGDRPTPKQHDKQNT